MSHGIWSRFRDNVLVLSVYFLVFPLETSQPSHHVTNLIAWEKIFLEIPLFSFMKLLRVLQLARISLLQRSLMPSE